jgi:hypothetical protein
MAYFNKFTLIKYGFMQDIWYKQFFTDLFFANESSCKESFNYYVTTLRKQYFQLLSDSSNGTPTHLIKIGSLKITEQKPLGT